MRKWILRIWLGGHVTAFAVSGMLFGCGRSESIEGEETTIVANPVVVGDKAAYAALMAENEALRKENQMLRRELISKNGVLPDSVMPEKGGVSGGEIEVVGEETGYWISSKTKVRHNKRCRNYRRVKGYPCGPNDGRPCKTCGG